MDFVRVGARLRAVRLKKRLRQLDVALRAGTSRAVVSRVERGRLGNVDVGAIMRVADVLGARVEWKISLLGADLDRLLNSRHSRLHEAVARWFLSLPGWTLVPEVSYSFYGERGVVDILAWHALTRTLLVIELKTEIVDLNELMGKVDQKRRLAPKVARERGWNAASVAVWVIVADSSPNRRRVAAHRQTLRAAFPIDGRSVPAWLRQPVGAVAALSFWAYAPTGSTKRDLAAVRRVRRPRPRSPAQDSSVCEPTPRPAPGWPRTGATDDRG